jgi:cyclase
MLKHRIIHCVLLKDWQLVKTIQFGTYRTIGSPTTTVRVYNARNVDELIVLDIDASSNDEPINLEVIRDMAEECYMPLTIGGGIRSIADIRAVLNAGADKICINTEAIRNPEFISKAASLFGAQCIVISIDIVKETDTYKLFNKHFGVLDTDLFEHAKMCETMGAGELLITSVDNEGMQAGYDLELLRRFTHVTSLPIIINGGAGLPEHCVDAVQNGADAVAAASIFHFTQYTPDMIKTAMHQKGIPVRYKKE